MKARENMESKSQESNGENLQKVFPFSVWTAWARRGVSGQPWNFSETQWDHHLSLHPVQFNCYLNGSCDCSEASMLPFGCSFNIWTSFALFISVLDSTKSSPISIRKAVDSFHCCVEARVNNLCAFFSPKVNGGKKNNNKTTHFIF